MKLQHILKHIKLELVKLRGKRKPLLKLIGASGDLLPSQVSVASVSGRDFDVLSSLGAKGVVRFLATRTSMCALALAI